MRSQQRTVRARDERGFTLTEMLVCIVLMGLVLLPITNALLIAIRTPAETSGMTLAAANRALLTNQWSDDAASADTVTVFTQTDQCPTSASRTDLLVSFQWTDTNYTDPNPSVITQASNNPSMSAIYKLIYAFVPGGYTNVQLQRTLWKNGTLLSTTTMLEGVCLAGDTVLKILNTAATGLSGGGAGQCYTLNRVQASFSMRDGPNDGMHLVNVEAAQRDTPTGASPPQPCTDPLTH